MKRRATALLGVVVLAMLIAAGGAPRPAAEAGATRAATGGAAAASRLGYVGRVTGTDAFVGIVVRGDAVTAYVCDGRNLARWFHGTLTNGRALLTSRSGGRLQVDLRSVPRGALRLPRRKALPFVASPARGRAGLFRAERAVTTRARRKGRRLTGWVRLNDGSVRGASVTSLYRILRPEPGIAVVLLAETGGTIAEPAAEPSPEERVTGEAVPICKWFTGVTSDGRRTPLSTPGCGIPRAGAKPPVGSGPRVISRPSGYRLSEAALAAFATRLHEKRGGQRGELLRRAQQSDPDLPSQSARALIATQAAAMRADSRLLVAAERLRGGTPAEVTARTDAYELLAGPYLDAVAAALPSFSPLVAIVQQNGFRPNLPARRTFRGPWADISHIVTSGDDWKFDENAYEICRDGFCPPVVDVVAGATSVRAHVRAGYDSSIEWNREHMLTFDVPPNAGDVEVEIDGAGVHIQIDEEDCFGRSGGYASTRYNVHRVTGGAVEEEPVTGLVLEYQFGDPTQQWGPGVIPGTLARTNDCVPGLAPPVPPPPYLEIAGEDPNIVLKFTAPPAGGTFAFSAGVTARAQVALGGTSVSQVRLGVDKVIIRHG